MKTPKIKQLLKRYLKGEDSIAERRMVDQWYECLEEEEPVKLDARQEAKLAEELWQQLQAKMEGEHTTKRISPVWWKVAATIILIASAGMLISKLGKDSSEEMAAPHFTSIITQAGERKVLTLKDHSVLTVKGGSSIRVRSDAHVREVDILDGEVFFEVEKDANRPFIVNSGTLTTRVLGTSFNVRAYKELNQLAVGVTSGKVSVTPAGMTEQLLEKDRQLTYDKERSSISLATHDGLASSWGQDRCILDNALFDEVALLIAKNYGIQIITNDPWVRKKRFTATVRHSMSATEVLEVIAAIHELKIKKRREIIEIYR